MVGRVARPQRWALDVFCIIPRQTKQSNGRGECEFGRQRELGGVHTLMGGHVIDCSGSNRDRDLGMVLEITPRTDGAKYLPHVLE